MSSEIEVAGPCRLRSRHLIPKMVLTERSLREAVAALADSPQYSIDIETDSLNRHTNRLMWLGLADASRSYLIPVDHPKGRLLRKAYKESGPAFSLLPEDDPKRFTPTGKPSYRKVEVPRPPVYAPAPTQINPGRAVEMVSPLLFSAQEKIGSNVKFDMLSLAKYCGGEIPPGPYHDTTILRHVLNENLPSYGLKELSIAWFRPKNPAAFYPKMGKEGVENFSLDQIARYLNKDLRFAWLMFHKWYPQLAKNDLQEVYDFEMRLYRVLMEMEFNGFPVDVSSMAEVRADLEGKITDIENAVHTEVGGVFSLSSTALKRWVLFGYGDPQTGEGGVQLRSQNLRPLSFTKKTEVPQVTQGVLEAYSSTNAVASLLLQWSELEKLRGTFIVGIGKMLVQHGEGQSIHTSFKQHGTVTGRLSASQPNLQQLPRGSLIRKLFVAGPGNVLIVADYDQIELRCLAHQSRERNMIRIFKENRDIHAEATAAAMRIDIADVTDSLRQVGKTLNFATSYGAGPDRIAAVAKVSAARGRRFLERYYDEFPALLPWKEAVLEDARARPDYPYVLIPPYGRKRRLPELHSSVFAVRGRAERQAINALIQGFASNITKLAMINLHQALRNYPARMVVQVHDEIIVQVDADCVDEVLKVMLETMGGVQTEEGDSILGRIPLVVSAKVGYTWAEGKGK